MEKHVPLRSVHHEHARPYLRDAGESYTRFECSFTSSPLVSSVNFQANVRMDADDTESRWVLAGAALLMSDD